MIETLAFSLLAFVVAVLGFAMVLRRCPASPSRPVASPKTLPDHAAGTDRLPNPAGRPDGRGRIKGRVRASSKRAVGDIVEEHPDEAISVLRRWIRSGEPPDGR